VKRLLIPAALLLWVGVISAGSLRTFESARPTTNVLESPSRGGEPLADPVRRAAHARTASQAPVAAQSSTAPHKALLDRYCVTCHNERLKIPAGAPLLLDKLDVNDLAKDAATWEKVVRKLGVGAMPPQGSPKPEPAALTAFSAFVTTTLDRAALAANNPGVYQLHRLNRTEYQNAIRDLLAVEVDVTGLLPPDSSDFGFDNIASVLQVTPALLERYLTAAVRISTLAVGDPKVETVEEKFPVRLDVTQTAHVEGLPIGTRGGTLVRHTFPVDGEYVLSASLFRPVDNADSGIEGRDAPNEFQILIDGALVHSGMIGGPEDHAASVKNLTGARDAVAERMKVRTFVTAGPHDIGFTFVERPARSQDIFMPPIRSSQDIHVGSELPKLTRATIVGPMTIAGVGDTPSRRRLFVCTPASAAEEDRCARQILSTLARRAYRRPVTGTDLEPVLAFYQEGRKAGGDFDAGIRAALPRVLASPSFLFRSEQDLTSAPVNSAHPISELELASRLSFFLWSSIPDDELLDLAIRRRLRAPGVLERQVRRMLADERSAAMTKHFPDQWLALRNLDKVAPDLLGFADFDDNLRQSFMRETELLFGSVVREDRGALDLLNADYTFLNERLARHYGVPGVYGSDFRRVQVRDVNRRGLLGHGSILTLTSVATRTSPVFRGKWILTNLLNTPPLPPPDEVPALEENTGAAPPKSVRERLETHRRNPVCASCHRNMDPIGFALENFDAVGQWRATTESGSPVDASGVLVDGTAIDGPVALRRALSSRPDVFVGTLTEKLLTYALGRGLQPYDMPVVRQIVREAAKNDYRMMTIVNGIVQSRPFQNRLKVAQDTE
jgi:cytochrome c5